SPRVSARHRRPGKLRSVIMRSWDGWLPRLGATILAASTMTASGANDATPPSPKYAASHYIVSTGDDRSPDAQGYQIGCAVGGAMDGEPAWSQASWARGWVDAYVRGTPRVLYAAGSADGCPSDGSSEACSRGWTVGDVFHISTGAGAGVVALPQIYRTDGIQ